MRKNQSNNNSNISKFQSNSSNKNNIVTTASWLTKEKDQMKTKMSQALKDKYDLYSDTESEEEEKEEEEWEEDENEDENEDEEKEKTELEEEKEEASDDSEMDSNKSDFEEEDDKEEEPISIVTPPMKTNNLQDKSTELNYSRKERKIIRPFNLFKRDRLKEAAENNSVILEDELRREWNSNPQLKRKYSNKPEKPKKGKKRNQLDTVSKDNRVSEINQFPAIIKFLLVRPGSNSVPLIKYPDRPFSGLQFYLKDMEVEKAHRSDWPKLSDEVKEKYNKLHQEAKKRFQRHLAEYKTKIKEIHDQWSYFYIYLLDMRSKYHHELTAEFLDFCRLKWVNAEKEFLDGYTSRLLISLPEFSSLVKKKNLKLKIQKQTTKFFLYIQDMFKTEEFATKQSSEKITTLLAKRWMDMSDEQKKPYVDRYNNSKEEFKKNKKSWKVELENFRNLNTSKSTHVNSNSKTQIITTENKRGKKLLKDVERSGKKQKK